MFITRKEYDRLLDRVDKLESEIDVVKSVSFENYRWSRDELHSMMMDFFKTQTEVVVIKRDKDEIVAELKSNAMNNIFKESK